VPQQLVARGVPEAVVDLLEPVQVQQQQLHEAWLCGGDGRRRSGAGAQLAQQRPSVGQSGELVGACLDLAVGQCPALPEQQQHAGSSQQETACGARHRGRRHRCDVPGNQHRSRHHDRQHRYGQGGLVMVDRRSATLWSVACSQRREQRPGGVERIQRRAVVEAVGGGQHAVPAVAQAHQGPADDKQQPWAVRSPPGHGQSGHGRSQQGEAAYGVGGLDDLHGDRAVGHRCKGPQAGQRGGGGAAENDRGFEQRGASRLPARLRASSASSA